jgi:hypothetical protein
MDWPGEAEGNPGKTSGEILEELEKGDAYRNMEYHRKRLRTVGKKLFPKMQLPGGTYGTNYGTCRK